MANPFISPNTIGSGLYAINNSNHAQINLALTAGLGDTAQFTASYPSGPGVQVTLVKGAASLNLLPPPGIPDTLTFPGRGVAVTVTPSGANTALTCDITVNSAASPGEAWSVRVSGLAGGQLNFSLGGFLNITRLMCDPLVSFTITANTLSGSNVKEKDSITLTSLSPTGPPATPTVVGAAPTVTYRWNYTGPLAITEFNAGCGVSPNFVFIAPGVYADATIQLTLDVWYDSPCPNPGFLINTSPAQPLTVQARPQFLMLALDRTGSMAGAKWNNASTAALMLAQMYVALRKDVSANDQVGILVFEDGSCGWHGLPRDPSMDPPILPLSGPGVVEDVICGVVLGGPGACTPIGDALIQAMQDLQNKYNANPAVNPGFTIVLLTDGIENSGHVYVDADTFTHMTPAEKLLVQSFDTARLAFPAVSPNVNLYTIGVGTDSQVQGHVLDQLAIKGKAKFRLLNDPTDIIDGIVQMVSFSRDAHKVILYPGNPPQPDTGPLPIPTNKRYFQLAAKASRLVITIEWGATDPSDKIELSYRAFDSVTGSFHGDFIPLAGTTRQCPTHGLLGINLAATLGSNSAENVPATEWRIVHRRNTAPGDHSMAIADAQTMIIEDLYVKADILFDQEAYLTGEPMTISAYLRAGDQPITGAKVAVELERPGEGMGTFFVKNAAIMPTFTTVLQTASRGGGGDPASLKLAYLNRLLAANHLESLPYATPPAPFPDGTNQLIDDKAHNGRYADSAIYTNTFKKADLEGTYTWRFTVTGSLPDGSPFNRVITFSKWVGVNVDPVSSTVLVQYGLRAPTGFRAAQVFVTPVDKAGQYLGPFRSSSILFQTSAGAFQGDIIMAANGQYSQILQYRSNEVPVVTVSVQGKTFIPVVVSEGCLGVITSLLRKAVEWVIGLFRR